MNPQSQWQTITQSLQQLMEQADKTLMDIFENTADQFDKRWKINGNVRIFKGA